MRASLVIAPDKYTGVLPLVFLAGPIVGADDWQSTAIEALSNHEKFAIANPRRPHNPDNSFNEQVAWESLHLSLAARKGRILFWCAKETTHKCDRAYAQTTRFELGEWLGKAPGNIVVGAHPEFTGREYIKLRCKTAGVHLYDALPDVVAEVLKQMGVG